MNFQVRNFKTFQHCRTKKPGRLVRAPSIFALFTRKTDWNWIGTFGEGMPPGSSYFQDLI